jgi:hypothetical protein
MSDFRRPRRARLSALTLSLDRVILHGTIQQIPAPGATTDTDMPLDELTAEADDYDTAYTRLQQDLPNGWRLIAVRRS